MTLGFSAIADQWMPKRDRVLWAPVFMGVGIVTYFALNTEPPLYAGILALAVSMLVWVAVWRLWPRFVYVAFCVVLVTVGFLSANVRSHQVAAPQLHREVVSGVSGRIVSLSAGDKDDGEGRRRVVLDNVRVERLSPEVTPERVRLSSYHVPHDARVGDEVSVFTRLMPPTGPVVPDGFDFRRQMFFEGVGASGFTLGEMQITAKGEPSGIEAWFADLRAKVSARIAQILPAPISSVTSAILVGERAGIPRSVNDHMRNAGLAHLLAISGMHLAVVCGSVFFFIRFLMALFPSVALRVSAKKVAAGFALGAGVFYMLLAGMPVPTVRSMIMAGLVFFAIMIDRSALSMRTIAFAAIVVMLLRPESLMGPSFQLSFAAVLAMIAFYEGSAKEYILRWREKNAFFKVCLYFVAIGLSTFLAGFATLPAGLHNFGQMQMFGTVGNAISVPLTTMIVMPSGVVALVLMPFGLDAPFIQLSGLAVSGILNVAARVSEMPYAILRLPSVPGGYYAVSALGFLFVCLWRGWWRFAGLPVMWGALVLGVFSARGDVLVDAQMRSVGVNTDEGIVYALKKQNAFVRRNWVGYWGGGEVDDGVPVVQGRVGSVVCDDLACRITVKGQNLSVIKGAGAMAEECQWAHTVLVTDKAAYDLPCAAQMVDGWQVRDGGGYVFTATQVGWDAQPIVRPDYQRPWVVQPRVRYD